MVPSVFPVALDLSYLCLSGSLDDEEWDSRIWLRLRDDNLGRERSRTGG